MVSNIYERPDFWITQTGVDFVPAHKKGFGITSKEEIGEKTV